MDWSALSSRASSPPASTRLPRSATIASITPPERA
jgi:hypothetical protein